MTVTCPDFVETSLKCPDWQAASPHLPPVVPGAAWHSQIPAQANGQGK